MSHESADGFILHHQVMPHCTDSDIAVAMVKQAKALFPTLSACSFDKGFHSPANQRELAELLDRVVLPKKGRWSQADAARETDPAFVQARRQHSAVESGINALEVHGLDYCPDRGLERFKRYVALAVVGRNLQKVGAILQAWALDALLKANADGSTKPPEPPHHSTDEGKCREGRAVPAPCLAEGNPALPTMP